ncbi:MAG: hypothetical protein EXR82_05040 [Gammaproteobacteria bacterium]|nr:hypothetical protein [Gammaproteobacteria bacterium]
MKNTKVESCRYGPDGSLQKTGEMQDQLEAAAALVKGYVPPDPNLMQAVIGKRGMRSPSRSTPRCRSLTATIKG